MEPNSEIPCARSEPINTEDAVVSALLWRAGETWGRQKGAQESKSAPTPFQSQLESLLHAVEQDDGLQRLLHDLPAILGSGLLLQPIFTRLFPVPPQPIATSVPSSPALPKLTRREQEILQEMAKGRSKKEIAEHLFISAKTVKTHVDNIYNKLEVNTSEEAVAKAAFLGMSSFDIASVVQPLRDRLELDYTPFGYILLNAISQRSSAERTQQLAALGLLLFLQAPLMEHIHQNEVHGVSYDRKGRLFEFTPEGRFIRDFGAALKLNLPSALAFAPLSTARRGFQAGHLYRINRFCHPNPLNTDAILEITPGGEFVRAFTGSAFLSTRLDSCGCIAFTPDGRMLVGTGCSTDALLEFTEGGSAVRRFADVVPYGDHALDSNGNVYVPGGTQRGTHVCVFNPKGHLVRTIGEAEHFMYTSAAIDAAENLYITCCRPSGLEVYTLSGRRQHSLGVGYLKNPRKLAVSPGGRLYVLDEDCIIHVFEANRNMPLFSFPAPLDSQIRSLTFLPNGNLLLGGLLPA